MIVIGIIVGVVMFVVAPALPQTNKVQTSTQLRGNIDFIDFVTADLTKTIFSAKN